MPASSSLTGAGILNALATPLEAQDPAGMSLTTTYSGTITVDVDNVASPTSITFVSANAVAANSGDWLPEVGGGSEGDPFIDGDATPGVAAPANYGFYLDLGDLGRLYAASRDTILSLNSSAKTVTGGQFDPFGIAVPVVQGVYESNVSSAAFGDGADSDDITDEAGANCTDMFESENRCGTMMGSYLVAGNVATLTLPLDFILGEGDDVQAGFTGTFIATVSLAQPLIGDYNENGAVDAADYVVWRENVGTMNTIPNDDIGGTIGQAHYDQWRANFGASLGAGSGLGTAVPEPATALLVLLAVPAIHWLFPSRRLVGVRPATDAAFAT